MGLSSKERPRNVIFGILPAQNCPILTRAKHRKRLIFAQKKTQKIALLAPQPHGNARGPEIKYPSLLLDGLVLLFSVVLYHYCYYYYYYYSSASTTMIKEVIFGVLLFKIIACTRVDPPPL